MNITELYVTGSDIMTFHTHVYIMTFHTHVPIHKRALDH